METENEEGKDVMRLAKEMKGDIEKEVAVVSEHMKNALNNIKLKFIANERSRTGLIQVINSETGELVKQINPDELSNFMAKPNEGVIGIILDEKAYLGFVNKK